MVRVQVDFFLMLNLLNFPLRVSKWLPFKWLTHSGSRISPQCLARLPHALAKAMTPSAYPVSLKGVNVFFESITGSPIISVPCTLNTCQQIPSRPLLLHLNL